MNKNVLDKESLTEVVKIFQLLNKEKDIENFMFDIFTDAELITLSKRWQILKLLSEGKSQRAVAKELNVGLCKVTRGAKILKNKKSIAADLLKN